eukprot:9116567-Alexandrium_andersonii.AAC.1
MADAHAHMLLACAGAHADAHTPVCAARERKCKNALWRSISHTHMLLACVGTRAGAALMHVQVRTPVR